MASFCSSFNALSIELELEFAIYQKLSSLEFRHSVADLLTPPPHNVTICLLAVIFGCEGDASWSGGASYCLQLTEGPGGGVVEGHPGCWVAVVLNGQQWVTQPHHVQNKWVRA